MSVEELSDDSCPAEIIFDVPKTNMLVLRTSNFQGVTIRPFVPRHNTLLPLFFTTKFTSHVTWEEIRIGESIVVNYNG